MRSDRDVTPGALSIIRSQIDEAAAAKKCHGCGCFQQTVAALAQTDAGRGALAASLAAAEKVFVAKKYDCLGCAVCYPAVAANAFADAFPGAGALMDLCPIEEPAPREGWPPLPGDYEALRYGAPVAVCTLSSPELAQELARAAPDALAIVGTMHTENLGIERLVRNVLANPNIRGLVLCGEDTRQAVGHLPGQSLASLLANGIDAAGRIIGAKGKRPVIKNVSAADVERFRAQVTLASLVGETRASVVCAAIATLAETCGGPMDGAGEAASAKPIEASAAKRLVPDPAGYFVVYPERRTARILVEHFTSAGVFTCAVAGASPADIYGEIVARGLVSRLDHAAYLGRELARAERALERGEAYVQDRAAGEESVEANDAVATSARCSRPCCPGEDA